MKILLYTGVFCILALTACNKGKITTLNTTDTTATSTVDAGKDWKFGVALWTFHTFDFPDALAKVDSAGLVYIEPNTFHKAGPDLKDSLILQLSPAGIDKLRALADEKGLKAESVYIMGDSTVQSWKKQFEIAKKLGAKFVTAEPPLNMWDSVDSLAGVYGMKVAIHEHWRGTSHYWHPDSVLAAIKDHPNFGACADLGHWPKSGINPLEAVKKLRGHIIGVHLKDIAAYNDPTLKDVPVGTGVVDFPAIFEELKKQRFNGHIYIERDAEDQPSNLPSVIQTIKYYNEQLKQL
ncbi:MAG: sugar phosphate isomerase/epimerase [Anditalea sp.]